MEKCYTIFSTYLFTQNHPLTDYTTITETRYISKFKWNDFRAQRAVVSKRLATVLRASERSPHRSQLSSHNGTKLWFFLVFRAVRGSRETHRVSRRFTNVNPQRAQRSQEQDSSRRIRSSFGVTLGGVRLGFEGKSQYQHVYRVH